VAEVKVESCSESSQMLEKQKKRSEKLASGGMLRNIRRRVELIVRRLIVFQCDTGQQTTD